MADTGAVGRLRIPDWFKDDVKQAWHETPLVARVFIGLALADVLSRGMGILQPRIEVGFDLFALYSMLIPHDVWILLPAVLVLRHPGAARATPLLFWGAVAVALVTLLGRPLESLVSGGVGPPTLLFEILVLESLARGIGWLLIARGLAELDVSTPSPTLAGLSNLVVILGGVALAAQLGGALRGGSDFGYPELGGIVVLSDLTAMGAGAAWLYLLWIAIRSFGDSRRPAIATMIAALGAAITGILSSLAVLLALVVSIANSPIPLGGNLGVEDVAAALSLVAVGIGETLLVVAFALGLGDPAVPDEPPA
jgi:hypothetical protein